MIRIAFRVERAADLEGGPHRVRQLLIMLNSQHRLLSATTVYFNRTKQDAVISNVMTKNSMQRPVEAKTVRMRGDKP